MEVVVDTNALSAWLDGDPGIAKPLTEVTALLLSRVALGEYRFGIQAPREQASYEVKLQQLEKRFSVLGLDACSHSRCLCRNQAPTESRRQAHSVA
jgi:predicted nucleic acid-binding protein